ncbi:hypothetical protein ABMA28_001424 [Loxostege sticticalis]|uniref:FLYWCH-type domain-containing protein n=1 Tax=Loxostege sticticalis TaxID=481309 RepID=A0ABD0T1V2_LOXSC
MLNDFTFRKQTSKGKFWVCTSKFFSRCEAKVRLEDPNTVVPYNLSHNHPPPSYHVTKEGRYVKILFSGIQFKMINSSRGGFLLMLDGFTFNKQASKGKFWVCTSKGTSRCEAKVRLEDPTTVVPYNLTHNHRPPSYHVTKEGRYVKV